MSDVPVFPPCRHRREPRHQSIWHCHSPKLIGLKMVSPRVCAECPYAEAHGFAPVSSETSLETMIGLIDGPGLAWPEGWENWEVTRQAHYVASQRYLDRLPAYPADRFRGRGIVIAGGGSRYFPSVYVTVRAIRAVGCTLPIQVWYFGRRHEMPTAYEHLLTPFGVECVDADAVRERHPFRILNGWELKIFAILHSPFEEVLSLDADCYPVHNPDVLFDVPEYIQKGAIFWPDFLTGSAPDWPAFQVAPTDRPPIESGQMVINKCQSWRPFQLACWYNEHSDWSYLHGYGDKNTFEVAWARCHVPYHQFSEVGYWSGHSYEHLGPGQKVLFIHRCADKFRFGNTSSYMTGQNFETNEFRPQLPLERECFRWLDELAETLGMPLSGRRRSTNMNSHTKPTLAAYMYTCPTRRSVWEGTMMRWKETDWGSDPVVIRDEATEPTSVDRIVANAHRMLQRAWAKPADAYLFLEDDLLFNSNLRANLENWAVLRTGEIVIASLYNPGFPLRSSMDLRQLWQRRDVPISPTDYFGAQAIVLSHEGLRIVLAEWDQPGPYDIRLAAIAAKHCGGMRMYSPSLIQHLPFPSTCGSGDHRAVNYDPFFRAPSLIEHFHESIHGWFDYESLYRDIVTRARPKSHFVEIGAWRGKSTAFLTVEILRSGKSIRLDVVDHWQGGIDDQPQQEQLAQSDIFEEFEANMQRGGVRDALHVVKMPSLSAVGSYSDASLDFVFIDGSHDFQSVHADIRAWLPKVRPGGVLAGHDWGRFEVTPAVLSHFPVEEIRVEGSCWVRQC